MCAIHKPYSSVLGVAVCGLAAVSCVSDPPRLKIWEGEYINYITSENLVVCGGTKKYLDRFVPFLSEELQVQTPNESILFRYLNEMDYAGLASCESPYGCTGGNLADSSRSVQLHEMTHAIANEVYGNNERPFFREGLAETYGVVDDGLPRFPFFLDDPRPTMVASMSSEVDYQAAGGFVAFILARFGPDRFGDFYREGQGMLTAADIDAEFFRVYGKSLDSEVEIYLERGGCEDVIFDIRPYDCISPEVYWVDGRWFHKARLACGEDDVIGAEEQSQWPNSSSVTLNVLNGDNFTLRTSGDPGTSVRFGKCFGCLWEDDDVYVNAGDSVKVDLDAGVYFMRYEGPSGSAPLVAAELIPSLP